MGKDLREAKLRDWIDAHIAELSSLIENMDEALVTREAGLAEFASTVCRNIQQLASASVTAVLNRKALLSLRALEGGLPLLSLGTEVALIDSPLPGRNPAADILALQTHSAGYVVIEIKNQAGAARQAVTELSAYSNGLSEHYWGLSSFDSIWLLISSEYRPTLNAAIAYQLLVSGRCVVPLRANVIWKDDEIESVTFSIEDVSAPPDTYTLDAIFCEDVFNAPRSEAPRLASPSGVRHVQPRRRCLRAQVQRDVVFI
jgi:hypothetical protein